MCSHSTQWLCCAFHKNIDMPKEKIIREIPNAKLLENENEIIIVNRKIAFRNIGEKKPCSNCNNSSVPKTIYEMEDGNIVEICFFCNKKIHNITSKNSAFKKF
jgi:hypothetical protein